MKIATDFNQLLFSFGLKLFYPQLKLPVHQTNPDCERKHFRSATILEKG